MPNFFIGTICAGAINYAACTTSLEQAANQTGATDMYNKFSQYTQQRIRKQVDPIVEPYSRMIQEWVSHVDKNILFVVGGVYKVYTDRGLVFTVHPKFANDLSCEVHPDGVGVKLKWIY